MVNEINRRSARPDTKRRTIAEALLGLAIGANASAWWGGGGWPNEVSQAVFDVVGIAWMTLPIATLVGFVLTKRLRFGTFVFTAPLLAAAVAWFAYSSLKDTSSSTAAIGVIWAPIFGTVLACSLWLADVAARTALRRIRSRAAG